MSPKSKIEILPVFNVTVVRFVKQVKVVQIAAESKEQAYMAGCTAAARITGWPKGEVISKSVTDVQRT